MYLIIAAHGNLSKEVVNSANMVFGNIENIKTVDFVPGENVDDLKKKYQEILREVTDDEILFLVDLFGGSPYNAAFEIAMTHETMDVITGLSLPLLIDVVGIREMEPTQKAMKVYEKLNKNTYIKSCKQLCVTKITDEEEEDEL